MGSYKLITGKKQEPYNPKTHNLPDLTELLTKYWGDLVTTEVPSHEEWECTDVLRNTTSAFMGNIAEKEGFDSEKLRFIPFTDESLLKFRCLGENEYLKALFPNNPKLASYAMIANKSVNYLVFKRKKIIEQERRDFEDRFFEKYGW
ncbi:MAG: hypothetical protein WC852_07385 [Candidatus Nanoarchaeia archaeon]|jgi:hypothetical protein